MNQGFLNLSLVRVDWTRPHHRDDLLFRAASQSSDSTHWLLFSRYPLRTHIDLAAARN